jgi:hypothetical protein
LGQAFAYRNDPDTGTWYPFYYPGGRGKPAFSDADNDLPTGPAATVNSAPCGKEYNYFYGMGSWIPMIRPYFGQRPSPTNPDYNEWPDDNHFLVLGACSASAVGKAVHLSWSIDTAYYWNEWYGTFDIARRLDSGVVSWKPLASIHGSVWVFPVWFDFWDSTIARPGKYDYQIFATFSVDGSVDARCTPGVVVTETSAPEIYAADLCGASELRSAPGDSVIVAFPAACVGSDTLKVTRLHWSGDSSGFRVAYDRCAPFPYDPAVTPWTLAPGETTRVAVVFHPTVQGDYSARLVFVSNSSPDGKDTSVICGSSLIGSTTEVIPQGAAPFLLVFPDPATAVAPIMIDLHAPSLGRGSALISVTDLLGRESVVRRIALDERSSGRVSLGAGTLHVGCWIVRELTTGSARLFVVR